MSQSRATLTPVVSVLPLRILLLSFIVSGEKFWELLTYFTYYDCNVYLLVTNVFLMIFPAWSHLLVLQPDQRSNGRRDIASVKYTASSVCNSVCFFFVRIKKTYIKSRKRNKTRHETSSYEDDSNESVHSL